MGPKSKKGSGGKTKNVEQSSAESNSAATSGHETTSHPKPASVKAIAMDSITKLASDLWASQASKGNSSYSFDDAVIKSVFSVEIQRHDRSRIQLLELSGYLENYLWLFFDAETASVEHILSIIALVNEKCTQDAPAFRLLVSNQDGTEDASTATKFGTFFDRVVDLFLEEGALPREFFTDYVLFVTNAFKSMELETVRKNTLRYLSLPLWMSLSKVRLQKELETNSDMLLENWKKFQTHYQNIMSPPTATDAGDETSGNAKKGKGKRKRVDDGDKEGNDGDTITTTSTPSSRHAKAIKRDTEFFPRLIQLIFDNLSLYNNTQSKSTSSHLLREIERILDLLIEILAQLPTRRFVSSLLDDMHLILRIEFSGITEKVEGKLITKLLRNVDRYLYHMNVNDLTGKIISKQDLFELKQINLQNLQKIAFLPEYCNKLNDLVYSSLGLLTKRSHLEKSFALLSTNEVIDIAKRMKVLHEKDIAEGRIDREFVLALLYSVLVEERQIDNEKFQTIANTTTTKGKKKGTPMVVKAPVITEDTISELPLYPTEAMMWDIDQLPPNTHYDNTNNILALPKLNLQFLTIHDYLMRNFELFRLESCYEIREDIVHAVKAMVPKRLPGFKVAFAGSSPRAVSIQEMSINEVGRPKIGEVVPSRVTATIHIDLNRFNVGDSVRKEWEALKDNDVIFLICIENPMNDATKKTEDNKDEEAMDFQKQFGVKYIRGATIFEIRDEADVILNDYTVPDTRPAGRAGSKRKLRVNLDPAQYYMDIKDGNDCYEKFNLLVRRDPKENNFKAVLETIRSLISTAAIGRAIPQWLQDVFLGYGDPSSANFRKLATSSIEETDYVDTFLNVSHVIASFPKASKFSIRVNGEEKTVTASNASEYDQTCPPPFKLRIVRPTNGSSNGEEITILPYKQSLRGPYPEDIMTQQSGNRIRFTPAQIEGIRSGLNPGLSLIVGPPGTGKTDVAVQIISTLYHTYPNQRILVVTHSNAALNDIFTKIMFSSSPDSNNMTTNSKRIDPRHMLRLGSGEADLRESLTMNTPTTNTTTISDVENIFSKTGRVNYSLIRRLQLLAQVQRLSHSLQLMGDVGQSCETAGYFYNNQIKPRIERYKKLLLNGTMKVSEIFPFMTFFADVPNQPLFTDNDNDSDVERAQSCLNHIDNIFNELQDYRAMELLRTQNLRCDYLLTKQARIVAMTCTHAAMTRSRLVELGFKFDSIVMEEAGQILEIETLIPMLLQDVDPIEGCRLKRVTLIGDHRQLPPIVQHVALQRYCKLEQSMFTRFIRLGVPMIQLDCQGRSRSELAALWSWRYDNLHDMDTLTQPGTPYHMGNAGFQYTYQFIDVQPFEGKGEQCLTTSHSYSNRGEAEYIVAVYQYMRLLGYPSNKISILTTYNEQKQLINDIMYTRCFKNPLFGKPAHITTVDKFQGQQNDYILLSLVRTNNVGYLRDLRRLIVALSRSKLGLYIFGNKQLYENCYELLPSMNRLLTNPTKLSLIAGEGYPTTRLIEDKVDKNRTIEMEDVQMMGILVYQMVQQTQALLGQQQMSL